MAGVDGARCDAVAARSDTGRAHTELAAMDAIG